jgi:isopentenyl phosphate kinase
MSKHQTRGTRGIYRPIGAFPHHHLIFGHGAGLFGHCANPKITACVSFAFLGNNNNYTRTYPTQKGEYLIFFGGSGGIP